MAIVVSPELEKRLEKAVDEGIWSAEHEPLVTPEEGRAHLAKVRDELSRGS